MNLTPRIDQAIRLACHLHRNQVRKDANRTPYVSHLFAVATLLSSATDDEDTIIAGIMHDSLEDVPSYTKEMLEHDFGSDVLDIVVHVTEPLDANKLDSEQLPWLERKEEYLAVLRSGSLKSALVSAADKIHNTESFLQDTKSEGMDFITRFHSSLRNKLWFHEEVLAIVTEKLGSDNVLVRRLTLCTDDFRKLVTLSEPVLV